MPWGRSSPVTCSTPREAISRRSWGAAPVDRGPRILPDTIDACSPAGDASPAAGKARVSHRRLSVQTIARNYRAASPAVRIHQNGGPEQLRVETVEVAGPGPDEVRLRDTAVGINFTDIHHRTGRYPVPGMPMALGMEAAGVVEAVGDESRPTVGARVVYAGATPSLSPGAYCQLRLMPAERLMRRCPSGWITRPRPPLPERADSADTCS